MYNILIVDDEELICKGLKSMIERVNHKDIGKIGFTVDSLKAEEMIEAIHPQIIITDIRMPELTGLDLIKNITKTNSSIKFIVLSGYDDFKFVKEAFKLGVQDYLLKPGSMEELSAILNKVISVINEEQESKVKQDNNTHKYMEAVLENKLSKIFGRVQVSGGSSIESLFNEFNISFPLPNFSVAILSFNQSITESKNIEELRQYLDNACKTLSDCSDINFFYFFDFHNNIVYIFNHNNHVSEDRLVKYLHLLMKELKQSINVESIAALSESKLSIKDILACHCEALEALEYRLIYESEEIIKYSQIKNKSMEKNINGKQLEKLKEYILSYKTIEISALIDDLFNKENIRNYSIKSISKIYSKVINKISDIVNEYELPIANEKNIELKSFNYLSDVKIYLKTFIFNVMTLLREKNNGKSISDTVKRYVLENYNKNIDMAIVANIVALSYSHFSKLFKEETGVNFSDYLVKVRMEKALEMLSNPVNKIQEISQKVGYSNPKHFTRAFKSYFGFSPTEYREG